MFTQLLAKSTARKTAERFYAAAAAQARAEALYTCVGAPDSVEGRFELLTLHVILLIDRLNVVEAPATAVRQILFDVYIGNLDAALREMGVGDLAVGKRMRKLGEAFYGRAKACESAFGHLPNVEALEDMVRRTVFRGMEVGEPALLADYLRRSRERLAAERLSALLDGAPEWPAVMAAP